MPALAILCFPFSLSGSGGYSISQFNRETFCCSRLSFSVLIMPAFITPAFNE